MYGTTDHVRPEGRRRLATLIGSAGDVIDIDDAVRILDMDRTEAAKSLARWTEQGWLRRVGRGNYVPASLGTLDQDHVLDDPWVLVPALFSPGYVGGRSAAEHWDLTEQIFNDIMVLTAKPLRTKSQRRHGANFTLKHISSDRIFGTTNVWRGRSKVPVSDVHRTIVDMLDDPAIGGGIRQVADCLGEYFRHPERDDDRLIEYAERLGNGAVFKRLGFLAEGELSAAHLVDACRKRLTAGRAKLDPALESSQLVTRWKLWIPSFWQPRADG
jgi:predicted transcriptional regulator of viral defense system